MNRSALWIGIVCLAFAGCDPPPTGDCPDVARTLRSAELQRANALVDRAEQQARESGCWWYRPDPGECSGGPCPGNVDTLDMTIAGRAVGNRVPGVDEPDFIKNDSEHIYVISGGALRILQARPAAVTREVAKVPIEGTPHRLVVWGDRALVYTSSKATLTSAIRYSPDYGYSTTMLLFDIRDRQAPRLVRELKLHGIYLAARRVGSAVHTVLSSRDGLFPGLFVEPQTICPEGASAEQIRAAFAAVRDNNARIIEETPLSALVPSVTDTILGDRASSRVDLLGACQGFLPASEKDGALFTTILTLDMAEPRPVAAATIASDPGLVFASATAMYVAVKDQNTYTKTTTVHRFALDATGPTYSGRGEVEGEVADVLWMDEWQGNLRVATSTMNEYGPLRNIVSVLDPSGGALRLVEALDIAPGKSMDVRFEGERGLALTSEPAFRTLDLHDPQHPRALSELKLTASNHSPYMQMMDAGHLLTIGYEQVVNLGGFGVNKLVLQIFDISDAAGPRLAHREMMGTGGSSSGALIDPFAVTYLPSGQLLALPTTICQESDTGLAGFAFNGLRLYDVTPAAGFKLRGQVSYDAPDSYLCRNWFEERARVRRSIILDDHVFSVTDAQIRVNSLSNLGVDIASVPIR